MTALGSEQETFKTLLVQSKGHLPSSDPLEKLRQKSWQLYLDLDLPHSKTEAYRYIKLRQLFSHPFQTAKLKEICLDELKLAILPECQNSCLVFINGHFCSNLSQLKDLPEHLAILTLQEASKTYGTFLNNQWAQTLKKEKDPFAALNGALHPQGAFLYIPPKTALVVPIQILYWVDHADSKLVMPRLQVLVGNQSKVEFIQTHYNAKHSIDFVNQVTDLTIEEAAEVHLTQLFHNEQPKTWHLDALRATLKRDSTLKTVCITEGSATTRTDYLVQLTGENSQVLLNGISLLKNKSEAHAYIFIDHQAPYCRSFQLFKGILQDFSRSSFEGKIMVRQVAQKTEAFQLNNSLILSDHAQADSKPNLEIFADDVKASHGATIGQLDKEQLFYMKTRGLTDHEAKNLLIFGFCQQVFEHIQLASLREAMELHAKSYLTI